MRDNSLNPDLSAPEWCITRDRYLREEDGFYEGLFALTNGRAGIRATVDFEAGGGSPGCFFSDLYGPALAVTSELVNAFNFAYFSFSVDGVPLHPNNSTVLEFLQVLDLYQAAVSTHMMLRDFQGRTTSIDVYTVLPATEPDILLTVFHAEAIDHSATVRLHSGIDWRHGNGYLGGCEPALQVHHLEVQEFRYDGQLRVEAVNRGTSQRVSVVTRHVAAMTGVPLRTNERFVELIPIATKANPRGALVRISALGTSNEAPDSTDRRQQRVSEIQTAGVGAILEAHREAWRHRWAQGEIRLDGPAEDIQSFRYGIFQLLQAPDRRASASNIAARGLTSQYHSGHFFFNTELFLVPYYARTEPAVARSLIMHRAKTLGGAREHARATGFDGARYPEEADLEGRQAAPHIINNPLTGNTSTEWSGVEVMHISADVLYAVARYLEATGDWDFVRANLVDVIGETARYLSSLMKHDPGVDGRGARRVMCFDEFHYHVDHHWATNYLAQWALRWAADTLETMLNNSLATEVTGFADRLENIGAGESERENWKHLADEIYLPAADVRGVYPQFAGYFSLPDQFARNSPNHRLPEIDEADKQLMDALLPFETRLIKQADVVLLMALFPFSFAPETVAANFDFYDPRTLHASSLSTTPHAAVAARLGNLELARHYLLTAFRYNLDYLPRENYLNGIHLAGYAGAVNALIDGFLGFRGSRDELSFEPQLPPEWVNVSFHLQWQEFRVYVTASQNDFSIKRVAGPNRPLTIRVYGLIKTLATETGAVSFFLPSNSKSRSI